MQDVSSFEIITGASIYNFHTLRKLRDGEYTNSTKQIENGVKAWSKKVPPSEIKAFEKIFLEHPKNITLVNNILSFDKVEGAKFYIIYKNKEEIKFTTDEIVDIIGDPEKKSRIDWTDKDKTNDKLDVRALSYSNTLGKTSDNSSKINYMSLIGLCFLLILLV